MSRSFKAVIAKIMSVYLLLDNTFTDTSTTSKRIMLFPLWAKSSACELWEACTGSLVECLANWTFILAADTVDNCRWSRWLWWIGRIFKAVITKIMRVYLLLDDTFTDASTTSERIMLLAWWTKSSALELWKASTSSLVEFFVVRTLILATDTVDIKRWRRLLWWIRITWKTVFS